MVTGQIIHFDGISISYGRKTINTELPPRAFTVRGGNHKEEKTIPVLNKLASKSDTRQTQLLTEFLHIVMEHNRMHTAEEGAFSVIDRVVDENTFFLLEREGIAEQTVDLRLGLDKPRIRRDQSAVKVSAAWNARPVFMLAKRGVGQQIDAITCFLQLGNQFFHAIYRENRLIPLIHKGVYDAMQALRQTVAHACNRIRLSERTAVHSRPLKGLEYLTHQEDSVLLRRTRTLDKVCRVKAEENVPHVKNNGLDHKSEAQTAKRDALAALAVKKHDFITVNVEADLLADLE